MRPLNDLYAETPVGEFGPLALKTVRERMIARGNSRTVINNYIGRIKRVFRWGVENELVAPEVYQALQAVAGLRKGRSAAREAEPVTPVDDVYVDAVRPWVSRQVWAMIELKQVVGADHIGHPTSGRISQNSMAPTRSVKLNLGHAEIYLWSRNQA